VASLLLVLWKKEPKFCLERSTVGGRDSSGTIVPSSTDGGGVSTAWLGVTGVCGDDCGLEYTERGGLRGGKDCRVAFSSPPFPRESERRVRPRPTVAASA